MHTHDKQVSSSPHHVVYILARGHSGSTLLDLMLDSHSEIVGLGECEKFGDKVETESVCACGKRAGNCAFWKPFAERERSYVRARVRAAVRPKWSSLLDRPDYMILSKAEREVKVAEYAAFNNRFYDWARVQTGARLIVDSSKNVDRVACLTDYGVVKPRVIHLVRDGRGVLWSYTRKYGPRVMWVTQWLMVNLKIEFFLRSRCVPHLLVHYDDLVRQPEETLRRVCTFLELPYEPSMLAMGEQEHHQIGGNVKVFSASEVREDTVWREALLGYKKQRMLFWFVCGWLNVFYHARKRT